MTNFETLGAERAAVFDLPGAGRYYLEFRESNDDGRSPQKFKIAPTFTATGDRHEPNSSWGRAAPITLGEPIAGSIFPKGDIDYMRVTVADQGQIALTLESAPDGIEPEVRLWSAEKGTLTNFFAITADVPSLIDLPEPGSYVLEIREQGSDNADPNGYRIGTVFTPAGDAYEPNNVFGAAAALRLDTAMDVAVFPKGDVDWFRYQAANRGQLTLTLDGIPGGVAPVVRLWGGEKNTVTSWLAMDNGPVVLDLPTKGEWWIEIREANNDNHAPMAMALTARFDPASVVTKDSGGTVLTGTLFPKRDSDWFRLQATAGGEMTMRLVEAPDGAIPVLRLWTAEKGTLTNWIELVVNGQPVDATTKIPGPGSYLVEIRSREKEARSTGTYRIRITPPGQK